MALRRLLLTRVHSGIIVIFPFGLPRENNQSRLKSINKQGNHDDTGRRQVRGREAAAKNRALDTAFPREPPLPLVDTPANPSNRPHAYLFLM